MKKAPKKSKKKKKNRKRRVESSDETSSEESSESSASDSSSSASTSSSDDDSDEEKKRKKTKKKKKKKKPTKRPRKKVKVDDGYKAWALELASSTKEERMHKQELEVFKKKAQLVLDLQSGGTKIRGSTAAAVMQPQRERLAGTTAPTNAQLCVAEEDED